MAALWVFIGFIAFNSAVVCLPPVRRHSGETLLLIALLLSLVGTAIVLAFTQRTDNKNNRRYRDYWR